MNFIRECLVTLFEHLSFDLSISDSWRETKIGALLTTTPNVIMNKDLLEYMEHPPTRTMFSLTVFIIWIRISISVLL